MQLDLSYIQELRWGMATYVMIIIINTSNNGPLLGVSQLPQSHSLKATPISSVLFASRFLHVWVYTLSILVADTLPRPWPPLGQDLRPPAHQIWPSVRTLPQRQLSLAIPSPCHLCMPFFGYPYCGHVSLKIGKHGTLHGPLCNPHFMHSFLSESPCFEVLPDASRICVYGRVTSGNLFSCMGKLYGVSKR